MKGTIAAFLIAFFVSAALTPAVRHLALAAGATDEEGGRRVHVGRIPRLGGLAVATAFFVALIALFYLDSELGRRFFVDPGRIIGLGLGGAIVLLLGAWDDLRGVGAATKLAFQALAALVAHHCGYEIEAVALPVLGVVEFGHLSVVVTVLWFVVVINALNLIDGLDGLAAGIAFFACITNIMVGSINGSLLVVLLSAALGGALMGFLIYNFNPASIFMGDSGSMFLGFVLAASSLLGYTFKSSTTVAILVPVIALGVPITDTVWAFARRLSQRRSIFSADRGHIHHVLLDLGLSQRRAVIILYAVSLALTALATGLALGRSLAAGGALVIMSMMLVGVVRTSRTFTLHRSRPIRPKGLLPLVEALRVHVPRLLQELHSPLSVEETLDVIEDFTHVAGIPECAVKLSPELSGAEHRLIENTEASPPTRRVEFELRGLDGPARITFWLRESSTDGQAHVLLQLVADGVEECLARALQRSKDRSEAPEAADEASALLHTRRSSNA